MQRETWLQQAEAVVARAVMVAASAPRGDKFVQVITLADTSVAGDDLLADRLPRAWLHQHQYKRVTQRRAYDINAPVITRNQRKRVYLHGARVYMSSVGTVLSWRARQNMVNVAILRDGNPQLSNTQINRLHQFERYIHGLINDQMKGG